MSRGEPARMALVHDRPFRRMLVAFVGFSLGEEATWLATLVYAYERGGVGQAGWVAVAGLVAAMVVAPFAAFLGDRFRTDHALSAGHFAQGVACLLTAVAIVSGAGSGAIAGIVVASASFTLTRPVVGALLPAITNRPADLVRANVTVGVTESTCVVLGPLIAAGLLAGAGPEAVFVVFAVTGLVSAPLTWDLGLRQYPASSDRMDRQDLTDQVLGGLRAMRSDHLLGLLVITMSIGAVSIGATDVLSVTLA